MEVGSEKVCYLGNVNNGGFSKVHMNILGINFSDTESSSMVVLKIQSKGETKNSNCKILYSVKLGKNCELGIKYHVRGINSVCFLKLWGLLCPWLFIKNVTIQG